MSACPLLHIVSSQLTHSSRKKKVDLISSLLILQPSLSPHRLDMRQMLLVFLLLVPWLVTAHQSISHPVPISTDVACRISAKQNCPGPCPRKSLRSDMTPNNPSVEVKRGGWIKFHTMKNNHFGGFSRWTMVHVRHMHDKKMHLRNVFLWSCADTGISSCSKKNHGRDCNYDKKNQYYTHLIQIPKIYPDGVYVLGWVWVGGGEKWGHFGDYFDCVYVHVKGGPLEYSHRPQFKPGPTKTGSKGLCRATVNKVGICWAEPCPGGGRYTTLQRPWIFDNGRQPGLLNRDMYKDPHQVAAKRGVNVKSISIRSVDFPSKVYVSSSSTKFAHLWLTKSMRITVTCEVDGDVKMVTFYVNGREGRTDYQRPFTIAGDWKKYRRRYWTYAPWAYDVQGRYTMVSCRAKGKNGGESWASLEFSTMV